ncbi:hypothetical protein [Sphingomonas sp. MMS24-J13]|uniref:hypothetical protein n=1 Tax=Sphingomonas sp. MMS24-J13 TaxID=3238686 RepID=UPI00384B4F5E
MTEMHDLKPGGIDRREIQVPQDAAIELRPHTASFRGDFGFTVRVRRQTFEEVEAIAVRILDILPEEVIRIDQGRGRVKLIEIPASSSLTQVGPGGASPPSVPPGSTKRVLQHDGVYPHAVGQSAAR